MTTKWRCIEMQKPKLNARHIEVATKMVEIGPRVLFAMQWQNFYGFGVGNFPALVMAGLVVAFDVGDAYGRKKYCVSPNAAEVLKELGEAQNA